MSKQERCWEYGDKSKWAQHLLRSMSVAYLSIDVGAIGGTWKEKEREIVCLCVCVKRDPE